MAEGAGFMKAFEALDLHPKLAADFAVRTKSGGFVSIAAIMIATALFIGELRLFWTLERIEHMEVDDMRGHQMKMRVNFDVTFPNLPCAMVSLDAMDASGSHSLDVLHNVFKKRLDRVGSPVGDTRKEEKGTMKSAKELLAKEKERAIAQGHEHGSEAASLPPGYCGSCYGAGEGEGACCNTCESVREAYRRKGWSFNQGAGMEQCTREGLYGDLAQQITEEEGCNMYGYLEVPKVPGTIHFGPSQQLTTSFGSLPGMRSGSGSSSSGAAAGGPQAGPGGGQVVAQALSTHDLLAYTHEHFNISHTVNSLSFGPYFPGMHYTLDGVSRILPSGSGMHQYFLKLVPTLYQHYYDVHKSSSVGGQQGGVTDGFQFSVTEHLKILHKENAEMEAATGLLPGLHFNYELSPMRVRIEERRRSFLHFLTKVLSIVGGCFTLFGWLDAVLWKGMDTLARVERRRRKGGSMGSGGLNVD